MENTTVENKNSSESCCGGKKWKMYGGGASGGCVYGLGLIGAAVYYIQHATTFGAGALGILKAIVWPAFLVYKLLALLG